MSPQPLLTIFIVALNCLSVFGQGEWKFFTPPGQDFSIMVPGIMRDGQKRVLTDIGAIFPVTWMCEGRPDGPNFLYLVSYIDYPEATFNPDSTEMVRELFDTSIRTHVEDLKGDLVYSSSSDHGDLPGAVFRASYDHGKFVVKGQLVLDGDRLYFLQVYTVTSKSLNSEMDRFLDSFRVKTNRTR